MPQCCALLCAMSVGAAIVIARSDAEDTKSTATSTRAQKRKEMKENINDKHGNQNGEVHCYEEQSKRGPKLLRKARDQLKTAAYKTIDFGQTVVLKTANTTYFVADRIGNSLKTYVDN